MSQRAKARTMLRANGHAKAAAAATVMPGSKAASAPRSGPATMPAKSQTAFDGGMLGPSGLTQGDVPQSGPSSAMPMAAPGYCGGGRV